MRIGQGYDVHRLVTGRKLILGGVEIPFEKGLQGHSDADALCHAIADALLGAAGLGDLGRHFPDSDDSIKGISSLEISPCWICCTRFIEKFFELCSLIQRKKTLEFNVAFLSEKIKLLRSDGVAHGRPQLQVGWIKSKRGVHSPLRMFRNHFLVRR